MQMNLKSLLGRCRGKPDVSRKKRKCLKERTLRENRPV